MFVISQYLLNLSGTCKNINQISTYSIITGLILYASIYLYLLFYNNEYLNIFNKFIIYIIVIDLLLSTFYYFNIQKSFKYSNNNSVDIETYKDKQDNQNKQAESDLESVDMSLISESESDNESEYEGDDECEGEECDLIMSNISELNDTLQNTEQELQQQELQQEQQQQEQQQEQELQQEQDSEPVKLNEIDELLSIPIPEVTDVKVKQKRGPKKKKIELQI